MGHATTLYLSNFKFLMKARTQNKKLIISQNHFIEITKIPFLIIRKVLINLIKTI